MADIAWCCKEHGKLCLRTIYPHQRGAIVNFLFTERSLPVFDGDSEEHIKKLWERHKGQATVVQVKVEEANG